MTRRLGADERALWHKVIKTVRPLHPQPEPPAPTGIFDPPAAPEPPAAAKTQVRRAPAAAPAKAPMVRANTLDGGWDRRLARGLVAPDLAVDLHGHSLDAAYRLLDSRLEQAIAMDARVLLLITGKPPQGEPPVARGKIRAAVGDWLAASRHAASIAAVRGAHPRHGGSGALYIVLRRRRQAEVTKS